VTKSFGNNRVLDSIDINVNDKEFVTLLGPSGCGKTTTLMSIAGFQNPDVGTISCGDEVFFDASRHKALAAERRNLGIVFQSYAIWPHMTVAGNVGFPLLVRRAKRQEIARRVSEMLELVELRGNEQKYPHQLSGGQQQRVAIARALASSPSVLLLDEPFSNLDAKLRDRSRKWLRQLQREIGITTIFVTHDQHEAMSMSDRVIVLDDGVIQQVGTPEDIYLRPASRSVADFVGQCNFVEAQIVESEPSGPTLARIDGSPLVIRVRNDQPLPTGTGCVVALRPETIELHPASDPLGDHGEGGANAALAEVRAGSFLGEHYEYEVVVGSLSLIISSRTAITGTIRILIPPLAGSVVH
jgi:iron(III) transport system ATP-binding protein